MNYTINKKKTLLNTVRTIQHQFHHFAFPSTFKQLLVLFITIQHYSSLFGTIQDQFHFFAFVSIFKQLSSLFITIHHF